MRGFEVRFGGTALLSGASRPDVLVIDDPSAEHAERWVRRAREVRMPVATLHDVGLAYVASDLVVDGSIAPRTDGDLTLGGPTYAALDPSIANAQSGSSRVRRGVLIALGGGAHVARWGQALAIAILERRPDTCVRIAAGFTSKPAAGTDPRVSWVLAPYGLAEELRQAEVAVVGGGLTLYEAAALSAPAVAVAVVDAQRPTIQGFVRRRAAVDGGTLTDTASVERVSDEVTALLSCRSKARRLGQAGARLVDGRGVFRVADALRRLARRADGRTHAA